MYPCDPAFSSDLDLNPFLRAANSPPESSPSICESPNSDSSYSFDEPVNDYARGSAGIHFARSAGGYHYSPNDGNYSPGFSGNRHEASFASSPNNNNIGQTIWDQACDPLGCFSGVMDPQRMARVQIIAEGIQQDNEARNARVNQEKRSPDLSELKARVEEYAADPLNDFDFSDPGRIDRIVALAGGINSDNHLIQETPSNTAQAKSAQKDNTGLLLQIENESTDLTFKEKFKKNINEINTVQKAFKKAQGFVRDHRTVMDPNVYKGPIAAQYNLSQEERLKQFENVVRGMCDGGVHLADLLQKGISLSTGKSYSSDVFLQNNLLGKEEGGGISYWTGRVVFELAAAELIFAKVGGLAGRVLSKVGQVAKNAGLEAAIYTKLTTGALGNGIRPFVPMRGGTLVETGANSFQVAKHAIFEQVAERITFFVKETAPVAENAPAFSQIVNHAQMPAADFIRKAVELSSIGIAGINQFFPKKSSESVSEVDSVANKAVEEMAASAAQSESIFKSFQNIIENVDDPTEATDTYQEFVYRFQMKNFFTDLDFKSETVQETMKRLPTHSKFTGDALEKALGEAVLIEKTITYCDKYVKSPWVRAKLLEILMPFQKHHVFSDKSIESGWTKEFKKILDKYDLDLNKHWNFMRLPHRGRHDKEYHEWVYEKLDEADNLVQEMNLESIDQKKEALLKILEEAVIIPLRENPLLPMPRWYKFWENDKLQADSIESSSTKEEDIDTQQ